jgi:hypothetical protein
MDVFLDWGLIRPLFTLLCGEHLADCLFQIAFGIDQKL